MGGTKHTRGDLIVLDIGEIVDRGGKTVAEFDYDEDGAVDAWEDRIRLLDTSSELLEALRALLDGPDAMEAVNRMKARAVIARVMGDVA